MKKLLLFLVALFAVLLVFTGCDFSDGAEHVHEWKEYGTTDPTCVKWGERLELCTKCLETREVKDLRPTGHTWDDGVITLEPTCVSGERVYRCTKCQDTRKEGVAPLYAHRWDLGEITVEPTCTESGKRVYHCMECDATRDLVIKNLDHDLTPSEVTKEPTCTKAGVRAYSCVRCKESWTKPIPATDHDWDNGTVTVGWNCGKAGEKTYACANCTETKTETVKATGNHQWGAAAITKEATCEKVGELYYTCGVCKAVKREEMPAAGHSWDNGEVTAAPTCGEAGLLTYSCVNCTETKTKTISPTEEHNWEEGVCSVCAAPEYPYTKGLRFELSEDGLSYTVIDYVGTDTEVVIPPYFRGKPVVVIGKSAFSGCGTITAVIIPSTVTSIGYAAFANCSSLVELEIPPTITSIGNSAFYYCEKLSSLEIPASVNSIGEDAFYYCRGLNSLTFAKESMCESIGARAFYYCKGLKSIIIPNSVITIGKGVFQECKLESLTLPSFNFHLGLLFYGYSSNNPASNVPYSLKTVVISGGTFIADGAFKNCSGITSITLPSTLERIGAEAFYGCKGLTQMEIPAAVIEIGSYAFLGCVNLASVTFSDAEGWYWKEGMALPVSNSVKAAEYLTDTYADCTWQKNEKNEAIQALAGDYLLDATPYGLPLTFYIRIDADETFTISNQRDFSVDKGNGTVTESNGIFVLVYSDSTAAEPKTATFTVVDGNLVFSTRVPVGTAGIDSHDFENLPIIAHTLTHEEILGEYVGTYVKENGITIGGTTYEYSLILSADESYTFTCTYSLSITIGGSTAYTFVETGTFTRNGTVFVITPKTQTNAAGETLQIETPTSVTGTIIDGVITVAFQHSVTSTSRDECTAEKVAVTE